MWSRFTKSPKRNNLFSLAIGLSANTLAMRPAICNTPVFFFGSGTHSRRRPHAGALVVVLFGGVCGAGIQ